MTTSVRIIANLLLHIISAFLLQLKCIKSFNVSLLAIHIKIRVNLYRMNRMEMLCHLHHGQIIALNTTFYIFLDHRHLDLTKY